MGISFHPTARWRTLAMVCAALCGGLLAVAPGTARAATATQSGPQDAVVAFARAHPATSASPSTASRAGASWASAASAACYGTSHTLPRGGAPHLDVIAWGLFYQCDAHVWQLSIQTSDNWTASQLDGLVAFFNTDNDGSTGCGGYDRSVVAVFQNNVLQAQTIMTPSCDTNTYVVAADAFVDHPAPNDLEVGFTNNDLGNPSSFQWHGVLTAVGAAQGDRFPAVTDLTEIGFPPVPAVNPCPPATTAGLAARMSQTADPTQAGDAARALLDAGLGSVSATSGGVVRFTGDPRTAAAALADAGIAAAISTDRLFHYTSVPNDPGYTSQWNLPLINMPAAWDLTTGSGSVVVADLDSGVDGTHPDLAGKLAPGYDVVSGGPLSPGNTDNASGHGTAVAGVIAAATNNGTGLAAVGWDTKIAAVKLSDPPRLSDIVAGITWATDQGIRIINMSLAGCNDPAEAAAVLYAEQHGVLLVAAAGNDFVDGNPVDFPAGYPGVIAVGATTRGGARAAYSEAGPQVSLVAPGGSADGNPADDLPLLAPGGGVTTGAGTSFAAPQVAGVAALIVAADPTVTPDDAGALVVATSSQIQSSPDDNYGHGIVNAGAALHAASGLHRAAGIDRFATAAAVSKTGWPNGATTVYVASGQTFPDALASGALAGVRPGPILLTDTCALPAATSAELQRLKPQTVYVVGGTAAVCPDVAAAVASAAGVTPVRIAGADRYGTDAALVDSGWPQPTTTVYVATGVNFPDGLTGSARAAKDGAPVLMTDTCSVPPVIESELQRLAPKVVKVLGGTAAVCPAVVDAISAAVNGVTVQRIAGATRVDTATLVVADGWTQSTAALVATAANFPDALSAGALAAHTGEPLLLNDPCTPDASVVAALVRLKTKAVTAVGGSVALCGGVVAPLVAALGL